MRLTAFVAFLGFVVTTMAQAGDYAVGQIWSYRTRPGEEASHVIIDKIERNSTLGQIYHVTLRGVRMKNLNMSSGFQDLLPHLPLAKESLDKSVTALIGAGKADPEFLDGYREWKTAFDAGKAGVWKASLKQIVGTLEKAINP